jgi:hypothetical protein
MYIVDAHQDIAYNTFVYGRDYRTPVLTLREREGSTTPPRDDCLA